MDGINLSFVSLVRGVIGILFLLFLSYLLSENRRRVDFKLVGLSVPFWRDVAVCLSSSWILLRRD